MVASAAPVPTTVSPVPFGLIAMSIFESPPVADNVGSFPVAGGGGGGGFRAGGGGAGGYRASGFGPSPLQGSAVPVTKGTEYSITVGAGGAGVSPPVSPNQVPGTDGTNSVFSSITSTGGGGGGAYNHPSGDAGRAGGSGGGGGALENNPSGNAAGAGNTPPVSPSQGNSGGAVSLGPLGGGLAGAGALPVAAFVISN